MKAYSATNKGQCYRVVTCIRDGYAQDTVGYAHGYADTRTDTRTDTRGYAHGYADTHTDTQIRTGTRTDTRKSVCVCIYMATVVAASG